MGTEMKIDFQESGKIQYKVKEIKESEPNQNIMDSLLKSKTNKCRTRNRYPGGNFPILNHKQNKKRIQTIIERKY